MSISMLDYRDKVVNASDICLINELKKLATVSRLDLNFELAVRMDKTIRKELRKRGYIC